MNTVAFQIGSLTIHWYGVFLAIGFLTALWTASRRAPKTGIAPETILDLGPWLLIGAVVGARALFVVSYWEEFAGQPWWHVFDARAGLVFYGGLIGASLATIIFVRRKRLPLWKLADVLAPSIALGHVFGRLGCLMNGCCYGRHTDVPWAIQFPFGHETHPAHVHPTQVYESSLNLGLFFFLAWLYRRKKFDGHVFAAYLVAYAVLRSLVEVFRGDYGARYVGQWITPAHLVSAAILTAGLLLLWRLPRPPARHD